MTDITLSEDRLRAILAEFKLDLIERLSRDLAHKADVAQVTALDKRIESIEQNGTREAREALKTVGELRDELDDVRQDVDNNIGWRNRMLGALALLSAVMVPLAVLVVDHYRI